MAFDIGRLAQVIHVTDDLSGADSLYTGVFGGERYYQGYSQFEMRDASLIAIGEFVIEPMAPAAEPGAGQMPVGRFFGRFGAHLHSIALNVTGVPELYEHLVDNNIRVVGPGGADPTHMSDDGVQSIYTHPKDTHCLLEFVDFGGELMAGCPRLDAGWDATRWRDRHPLGLVGPSHVTVVVRDLDAATKFFVEVLGCHAFHEAPTNNHVASRFLLIGTETVLELNQPADETSRAGADLAANGEIVHSVTLRVLDLDAASAYLAASSITVVERSNDAIVLDPVDCFGALIRLTDAPLPNDPRP